MNMFNSALYSYIDECHFFIVRFFKSLHLPLQLVTQEIICPSADDASVELYKEDRQISTDLR